MHTGSSTRTGRDSRPGGGLGPPIDAPDPLQKYRWYILGGCAALLAIGAFYVTTRQQAVARAGSAPATDFEIPPSDSARARRRAVAGRSGMLLEALKEEIFQLEVDRKLGRVSAEEYEKAKAALDQTLERAIKRETQKV